MATVRYVGSFDAVEVPSQGWVVVAKGETLDIPSEDLPGFASQDVWEVVEG